ncbi:hyaline domain-containing protein, partial [Flavobacterium frigoris PS1]
MDNCSVASVIATPASLALGANTVTWTATDGSGKTQTASQIVTVTDNVKPTITAPANVNVTTNTACTATGVVLGTPATADNCSVANVTNDHPSTTYPLGSTTVIWTVTDGSGNTQTAIQIVTVTDNVKPTISCPGNLTPNVGIGTCTASVATSSPTTADNCTVTKLTWTLTGATTGASA